MNVQFANIDDVREFVGLATLQPYEIHVFDGDTAADAKSFMQMFTLNFAHPLHVEIAHGEDIDRFSCVAAKFIKTGIAGSR